MRHNDAQQKPPRHWAEGHWESMVQAPPAPAAGTHTPEPLQVLPVAHWVFDVQLVLQAVVPLQE